MQLCSHMGAHTRELTATHLGCKVCQLKGQSKHAGRRGGRSSPAIYDELSAVIVGQGKDQLQSVQYDTCCVLCSCLLGQPLCEMVPCCDKGLEAWRCQVCGLAVTGRQQ